MDIEKQIVSDRINGKVGSDSPGGAMGSGSPVRWSSPLVRQHLSGLHSNDSRDSSLRSLRQHVQHMDSSAIPRFVHHVSESTPEGSSRNYAVALYADCARTHGALIIPHMPKVMASVLRQLAQEWSSPQFHQACAEVLLEIVRSAPTDAAQTEEVLASMAGMLALSLGDRCEPLANGAAVCLHALVVSEKWKMSGDETLETVWKCTAQAVADPLRTLAQLQLARALVRTSSPHLQKFTKGLLTSAQDILLGANSWQQRLYAIKLAREVLTRCDEAAFAAEVGAMEEALLSCGMERVELVSQEMTNLLKVLRSLQEDWAPMAFAEDFTSPSFGRSPQEDGVPSRFRTPPRRDLDGAAAEAGGDASPAALDPLFGQSEVADSGPRSSSLGGRGPSPLRGSATPSRRGLYSGTPPGATRSRYRSPTVSSIARAREPGAEAGSGGLGARASLRRNSSGGRAGGLRTGGSPGVARARLEYGQSPENLDRMGSPRGSALMGSGSRRSLSPANGVLPRGPTAEKGGTRMRRMSLRNGEGDENGGEEEEGMGREDGGRGNGREDLTGEGSTAESDASSESRSREFGDMGRLDASMAHGLASPGAENRHAEDAGTGERNGEGGGESIGVSGGATWTHTGPTSGGAEAGFCGSKDAEGGGSKSGAVVVLGDSTLINGPLGPSGGGDSAKFPRKVDGRLKESGKVHPAPMNDAPAGGQRLAASRDSSAESPSGCTSTTTATATTASSCSEGQRGPIRMLRPLEPSQAGQAKKRPPVTPEDTMRDADPRRLLISLQSGSPAPAKEASRAEPTDGEAGSREGELGRAAASPHGESGGRWFVRDNPIATLGTCGGGCDGKNQESHGGAGGATREGGSPSGGVRGAEARSLGCQARSQEWLLSYVEGGSETGADGGPSGGIEAGNRGGKGGTWAESRGASGGKKVHKPGGQASRSNSPTGGGMHGFGSDGEDEEEGGDENMELQEERYSEESGEECGVEHRETWAAEWGPKTLLFRLLLWVMKGIHKLLELTALGCLGCVVAFLMSLLLVSLLQASEMELDLPPT